MGTEEVTINIAGRNLLSINQFGEGLKGKFASWCGYFVNEVYKKAGVFFPDVTHTYAGYLEAKERGLLRPKSEPPVKGDVAFFKFNNSISDPVTHVGIIVAVNRQKGTVLTIEGNTSDGTGRDPNRHGVFLRERKLSDIVAVGEPKKKIG